jgi:hypothetical protein
VCNLNAACVCHSAPYSDLFSAAESEIAAIAVQPSRNTLQTSVPESRTESTLTVYLNGEGPVDPGQYDLEIAAGNRVCSACCDCSRDGCSSQPEKSTSRPYPVQETSNNCSFDNVQGGVQNQNFCAMSFMCYNV